ncbi:lectin-like domain-containing protein [Weissella confusa]|uniref:LPXTG cell wall anchor domain-containing protein n=1 Tax=Weissella confusa TaxID=1583 RepID=A0AAJ3DBJ4_WEICO|nr:KxYKxGKxW signal peptide domain-containing protein [Weissella confusa]NBA12376.1 LPXTG cell wall anchor domain-containing protein [Weissella confusa]
MGETKTRKKMYKSGKFWVAAGLTALSVGVVSSSPKMLTRLGEEMTKASAAQTTSTMTIDTVTDADTDSGASRYVVWGPSGITDHDEYAGKGTYNGTAWSAESSSVTDPGGQNYAKLTANGSNTIGYYYINRQFDASQKFTIDGYFHPDTSTGNNNLASNGNWSDWVGLVLTPTDPGKMASDYNMSYGGGGLGIQGFKNAYALGLDFYQNSGDPAAGPFGALRATDSSGNLTSVPAAMYTNGQNLTQWKTTVKYQMTWWPTGGPGGGPYITASLKDTSGKSWTINTNQSNITLVAPKAFSIGVNAANGQKAADNFASIDNLSGTFATGTTTVKYVYTNGNTIKPSTSFIAAVNDTIGITGLSPKAKAGTADYAFAAPTIRGYKVSSATDVNGVSQTAANNTITITYTALPYQESIIQTDTPALWSGSNVITSYWSVDQDNPLGSSATVAQSIVDASLVRSGYSYYITDPNGGNYSTMSSAYAAATNVWDSTSNTAGVQSDGTPQTWTVKYMPDYQGAYLYTQNFSYANGSYVAGTSTYKNAAGGRTGNAINFATKDSNLPKSGYTYTVTGLDNVTYSTLDSAIAANSFDSTNNRDANGSQLASSDTSYQSFVVNYTPATQTTSLVVDSNSPVKAGSVLASSLGATSATLSLPYTDANLTTAGFSYVVKGPNGSTYATLSSAVAANSIYDATNNSGTTDSSAQVFTVSYVGAYQAATVKYDPNGPISAGSTLTSASGTTGGTISFATNDTSLVKAGYTYTVKYAGTDAPDSTAYTTLSSAVAAHPRYDNTTNTGSSDTSSQAFVVTYKTNQYASLFTDSADNSGNSVLGYSAVNETTNGPASSAISFKTTDSQLAKSGYTYVVNALNAAGSVINSYTTLTSAVAANKYDNTSNAANATTDAQVQRFKVVYAPMTAKVTYNYVDQAGKVISTARSANGYVGSKIPDGTMTIAGYTLVGKDSNSDADGLFDADLDSIITYVYKPQYQAANLVVDSASPISANSAVESASGVTSGSLAFSTADSQLAKTGYTYVVYGPKGDSYATLTAALKANSLYDNTENGSASADSSAQTFRVSYTADAQSAYIRVQQNSPVKAGSSVANITGVTSQAMSFGVTDADLATSGYTYTVGYGYDVNNTVWYSTLSQALAANSTFDNTDNTGTTDAAAQRFVVLYAPMSQAASVVVDVNSPISAGSTALSANGSTGSAISFTADSSYATLDSQLAKSGYTYTVKYGSDTTAYTTLSSALSAHSYYNANNTVSGTSDANPDMFTVSYKAASQSAVVNVAGTSPIKANSKVDSATGVTSGALSFATSDASLAVAGYTYTVTGPDGKTYTTLSSAVAANSIFDNTTNTGSTDSAIQSFTVSYKAAYQSAALVVDADSPISANSSLASAAGVTKGAVSFAKTDSQLAVQGYTYVVYAANGSSYATLTAAMAANGTFDDTDNGTATSDGSAQVFRVSYKADSQQAKVTVISAGSVIDSAAGPTSGAIAFGTVTDSYLYTQGYHYTVSGPDGTSYSTLSQAIAANSAYDNTHNTGSTDSKPQTFTVNYVADMQWTSLGVTSDSPISAGSWLASLSGGTATQIPFKNIDDSLAVSGYTYRVLGPDGEWYATLADAQSANTTFDNTSNAGDSDAETQNFMVSYAPMSQAATIVGAANSPIQKGKTIESASGLTGSAIAFSNTDTTLARSGYRYVVYMGSDSATTYSTLAAAMAANTVYDNTNNTGSSDAAPQVFTVSYIANYQSANLVIGGATQISSGVTLDSAAGVTSGQVSFATTDSALDRDGYRYIVKTPNGNTYETLASALTGMTGLYDNTNNATESDSAPQTYTVEYSAITQTAEVVVGETGDEYSGSVIEEVTGDTGEVLGLKTTDETLRGLEMTHGYTYNVTVQHADGTWVIDETGAPKVYATLDEAIADNNSFDAVDTGIKRFILNATASYQESTLIVSSDSPISAGIAIETISGVTKAPISYAKTDTDLAVDGYQYNVSVVRTDGTSQAYTNLSAAVAAESVYDNTINGDAQSDSSAQSFVVSYKADYQSANISFDGAPMSSIAAAGMTSGVYTSTYTAPDGYYFKASGQPSGTSVAADGRTATFTFTYDNTNNASASDSAAQDFTLQLSAASQSGQISFVYSGAIGSPTTPDPRTLSGVTGDYLEDTITAPEGYYIVAIDGSAYNVSYVNNQYDTVTYTLTMDDTDNGNEASDKAPQNLVITLAPNNQKATVTQHMPDGTTMVTDTQNGKTAESYGYMYTAPAGYYVASGAVTTASGITADIATDGKTVSLDGNFDSSKDTGDAGTDTAPQNTDITLTQSKQQAQFKINVPDGATSVSAKNETIDGLTGGEINAPTGYTDDDLVTAGYTYKVTGPTGAKYDTMAEALAATSNFDNTNNGSGEDTDVQKFVITYVADDQMATITQQYVDGSTNTPAFPQADATLNGKTDQQTSGTITAPTGYEISDISVASGISWTISDDKQTATYKVIYDAASDADKASQATIVTYTPLPQKIDVQFFDEVGRPLTSDTGVTNHTLNGVTNEAVNYQDADLVKDAVIAGYSKVIDNTAASPYFDDDTDVDQRVRYVYRDVQAPTVTTTKTALTTSKAGMPADEATFLIDVGFSTTDNQQHGDSTIKTDYETIAALVAGDGQPRDVTITVTDATGNKTTKTVTLSLIDTAPVSQEQAVKDAQKALDDLAKDPNTTADQQTAAEEALQDAIDQAMSDREAAETAGDDALNSPDTTAVATDDAVADAMEKLDKAMTDADNDQGTTQAIKDTTDALENAVARAEAKAVDTAPVSQEPGVQEAQSALNDVLNDPNATTEAIDQAKQALQDAVADAKSDRDKANDDANTTVSQVTDSKDDAVKQAVADLEAAQKDAANNVGTTQAIEDARQAVIDAVKDAGETALAQDATPVQNEASVINKKQALEDVLNNPDSTPDEIVKATNDYNDAVEQAKADRDAANEAAQDEIATAGSSHQANDQSVIDATKNLQDLIDKAKTGDASALTEDIDKATQALKDAVAAAGGAQEAARADAAKALNETSPVTYEPDVQSKIDDLQKLLDDPASTADQINDATEALRSATETAINQRTATDDDAKAAINAANGSNQADEPAVQAAEKALQDLVDQAQTDTPDALTADIQQAIKNLQDAVSQAAESQADARQVAEAALQATAPVSNEATTSEAIANLQNVLNDTNATAEEIKQATDALTEATASDKASRDETNRQADDAVTAAKTSDQATEPEVIEAIKKLQDTQAAAAADSSTNLTADIQKAIDDLAAAQETAKQNQTAARDAAADAIEATKPVSNESTVLKAHDALQKLLDNPASSTADIKKATKALTEANQAEQAKRDAINDEADKYESKVETSSTQNEPTVQAALDALNEIQEEAATDTSDALTADIAAALDALQTAVVQAAKEQAEARDNAADALARTAPVSNEKAVADAISALNKVLDDPAATTKDIKNATQNLMNATSDDKVTRTTANTNAQNAITDASNTPQADEPAVQDAIAKLQDVMKQAANDDSDALTADIDAARNALKEAVADAKAAQEQARKDAAVAIASANPVSHELGTAQAISSIEAILTDSNSTTAEIQAATKNLNAAIGADKTNRDAANTAGTQAIADAQGSDQSAEPSVQAAINNLKDVMATAATDSDSALTKDIQAAIDALQTAQTTAANNQQAARDDAQDALSKTAPVSHEPAVADAISNLQKLLDDPTSTTKSIADATQALRDAVATAQPLRDAANEAADAAAAAVPTDLAKEPTVQAALDALDEIQKQAAADQDGNLTKDIEAATKALQDAIATANTSREAARNAANDLLGKTAPVSHEAKVATAKDALQKLLDDPTSTKADIENATAALRDALQPVGAARTQANDTAKSLIDIVKQSAAGQVPAVQEAMKKLQDIMNRAAGDNADALTADIEAATKALETAVATANNAIEAARNAANDLLGKTAPVSHEAEVANAITALKKILDDPNASAEQITAATKALQTALDDAKAKRTDANQSADKAIASAKKSSVAGDPAVQKALDRLQAILEAAAKDSSNNLTADIEAAIKALQAAVTEAEARNVVVPPVQHPTNQSAPTPAPTVETVPQPVTEVQTQAVPVPTVATVYVTQPAVARAQTPTVYALPYATESNRIGTLPNTGYKDDWRLMALGIFLFSSTLLLLAAKRRKKDEED